jgi:hypothetical protein
MKGAFGELCGFRRSRTRVSENSRTAFSDSIRTLSGAERRLTKIPNPVSELRSSFSHRKNPSEPKATLGSRREEREQLGPSQNGVAPLQTGPLEPSLAVCSVRLGPVLGWPRLRSNGTMPDGAGVHPQEWTWDRGWTDHPVPGYRRREPGARAGSDNGRGSGAQRAEGDGTWGDA